MLSTVASAARDAGGDQANTLPKNVHHFCTVSDDVMLPDYYRGTWRKYHVPSKYDNYLRAAGVSGVVCAVGVNVACVLRWEMLPACCGGKWCLCAAGVSGACVLRG